MRIEEIAVILFLLVMIPRTAVFSLDEEIWPLPEWPRATPSEMGLDESLLRRARDYALSGGGSGLIIRHGKLVMAWGDPKRLYDLKSTTKSIGVTALGLAIKDGKMRLNDKAIRYHPSLGVPPESNRRTGWLNEITILHLATQTAGFAKPGGYTELLFKPGTMWHYSDGGPNWLAECITLVYRRDLRDLLFERVFTPLGIKPSDLKWRENAYRPHTINGIKRREFGSGISADVDAMARIGYLYLREGRWREEQIIPKEFVDIARRPVPGVIGLPEYDPEKYGNASDHYGLLWWNNGDGTLPDVPRDAYWSWGLYDSLIVVIPSLDIVVARAGRSWQRGWGGHYDVLKPFLQPIAASVQEARSKVGTVPPLPDFIVADPKHPRWLCRRDGRPFFMCGPGDPEDFLYRGRLNPDGTRSGDQMELIHKLKDTGANCIYLMAVRSHGGDGDRTQNPFIDHDPAKGINPKVLDQWEAWFAEMDKNGIVIFFIFYDDSARIWDTGDEVGEAEREFIRTLVDRFEHHRNLIWCVAEEYQEAFSPERVRRLAAEIRAADEYDHPIAVHKLHGLDFSEFADDPNIDQFAIQYNVKTAEALHRGVVAAWRDAAGRYNLNMAEAANFGTGTELRRKLWACAMGGAYVMVLGMDIAHTPLGDLKACGHLVHFFESTNFYEMAPHDELRCGDTECVLAKPGESYIAYASKGTGRIGLKGMTAGTYTFRWFDPITGRSVVQNDVQVKGGDQTWSRPAGVGHEVAVYIRREVKVNNMDCND